MFICVWKAVLPLWDEQTDHSSSKMFDCIWRRYKDIYTVYIPCLLLILVVVVEINGAVSVKYGRDNKNVTSYSPFIGSANINLYGTLASAVAVTIGEGLYLGSKYIGVIGSFIAVSPTVDILQAKMNATALKGSYTVTVTASAALHWKVGQEVSLAPTAYFTSTGSLWSNVSTSGVEKKTLSRVSTRSSGSLMRLLYSIERRDLNLV